MASSKSSEEANVNSLCSDDDEAAHETAQKEKEKYKKKKYKSYGHKYQTVWEKCDEFKSWITVSKKGPDYFFCKYCATDYKCGKSEILKHLKSMKHSKNAATFASRQTLPTMKTISAHQKADVLRKENEIRISAFIAQHNLSFNLADHLVRLIKNLHLQKEVIGKMTCGKTKCSAITKNVTSRHSFELTIEAMQQNKFSILIDESTDVSSIKHLAIVTRILKDGRVHDEFVCILQVSEANAINMYTLITAFFNQHKIPYKENMVGFAADGASVMMGKNHSVSTMLKADIPNLFILKCICHSFALCASKACAVIPDNIEWLIRQIYNYMHQSFKRQKEYETFQLFAAVKPLKLLHPSQTRWLSLQSVVDRVLDQYAALELYFASERKSVNVDNAPVPAIHDLLSDPITKMYLQFLSFALPFFTDLNRELQSEATKIHLVHSKISIIYKTILECYIKDSCFGQNDISTIQYRNPANYKSLEDLYLGPAVRVSLGKIVGGKEAVNDFKLKCLSFYAEAAHQIYIRFPFNSEYQKGLEKMTIIDPEVIVKTRPPSIAPLVDSFPIIKCNLNEVERQWRIFRNDDYLKTTAARDLQQFWMGVSKILNGDGTMVYKDLHDFVTTLMVLPHSTATVERLFSQINLNKTKLRNKLSTSSISAILRTKALMEDRCCYEFAITEKLLKKHNNAMYESEEQRKRAEEEEKEGKKPEDAH